MHFYLPIAEIVISAPLVAGLGALVGVLSGLFGVGGGFILTPLLFMIGIPPAVAVGTQGSLIAASSLSGMLAHMQRRTVDVPMGLVLLAGGLTGATLGVRLFRMLTALGQIDLIINLAYVLLLGIIGALMLIEGINAARTSGNRKVARRRQHGWVHKMPFRYRFRRSQLYISVIPPFAVGVVIGILSAIMGVGGGFLLLPAMIYLLGIPTKVVVGTSLLQITFTSAYATLLHAIENQTVDLVLGIVLLAGGVIGAQIGSRLGSRLKPEAMRILLALLVLAICLRIAYGLVQPPADPFSLS